MNLRRETALLTLAGGFVLTAALALTVTPYARADTWTLAGAAPSLSFWVFPATWLACAVAAHAVVQRRLPQHDPYLLPLTYLLTGWGLALIWRLTPTFGLRQTAWLVVGTAALVGVVIIPGDLRWLQRYRYTWLAAGLLLTALTFGVGVNPEGFGPRLWLGGFGLFLQPAELLKVLLVVFLAAYLADRRDQLFSLPANSLRDRLPYFLPLLTVWGFSLLIVVAQRDLGMGTLFFAVFLALLYLASGQGGYIVAGLGLLLLGGGLGYRLFDVVRVRVDAWWNPWADPTGRSYQIVQGLIAIAAGGVFGRGPGLGAASLIPVAHSDFIFAALAEEWGLVGTLAALALLALLVYRGLHIAMQARGAFATLLASGLTALLAFQTLIIVGGVTKVIPLTGLTLPLLSYGGSSLLASFTLIGLLLKLSSHE